MVVCDSNSPSQNIQISAILNFENWRVLIKPTFSMLFLHTLKIQRSPSNIRLFLFPLFLSSLKLLTLSFLRFSQEVLTSELLYRLTEDISTLKRGKDRSSAKALSVTEELLRLLEWMSAQQSVLKESVAEEVEKVKQVLFLEHMKQERRVLWRNKEEGRRSWFRENILKTFLNPISSSCEEFLFGLICFMVCRNGKSRKGRRVRSRNSRSNRTQKPPRPPVSLSLM